MVFLAHPDFLGESFHFLLIEDVVQLLVELLLARRALTVLAKAFHGTSLVATFLFDGQRSLALARLAPSLRTSESWSLSLCCRHRHLSELFLSKHRMLLYLSLLSTAFRVG